MAPGVGMGGAGTDGNEARMKLGDYELDTIITGDARELMRGIPDESVDLIFTDPVYDRIDDYRWLAQEANRVLKPDSALLCFCGIGYLPETHNALIAGGMSYRWRLIIKPVYKLEFHGRLLVASQEVLWYEKGKSRLYQSQMDVQLSTTKGNYKVGDSNWGKSHHDMVRYVNAFSQPGLIVLDPFSGSGTTAAACKQLGRNYLGFEIDPDTAELARQRVRDTQPPLFVVEHEQLGLDGLE